MKRTYVVAAKNGSSPAVIALVLLLFFVFALASAKTKNNKEQKYRSAEG